MSAAHGRVTFSSNPAIGKWPRHIKAYYSTVFEQSAPQVWKIARDFNNYPVWMGGAGESGIERSQTDEFHGAATLAVAIN